MSAPYDPGFLGYSPTVEPLKLTTGASFVQTIQPSDGATFPSGTTAAIVITDPSGNTIATWSATVSTTTLSWLVASAAADPIPANSRYTLLISFPTIPVSTYAWYEGTVLRT